MSQFILTSVNQSIMFNQVALSDEMRTAASYISLFGQDGALGILKSKGVDVSNPAELMQTEQYYNAFNAAIVALDFVKVVSDSTQKVDKSTHSGDINIGQILETAVQLYLGVEAASAFDVLSSMMKDTSDTGVTGFLDLWWKSCSTSTSETGFSAGPITLESDGTVSFGDVSEQITDWRALFISFHSENLDVYTTGMKFNFDMAIYNANKDTLITKLGSRITQSINSIPF
jgi:hypothetical protein